MLPYFVTWLSLTSSKIEGNNFKLNRLPDKAEGLSFTTGSGDDAPRLDDLWGTNELLSTFGFRKNLFLWFGGVGQPVNSISYYILSILLIDLLINDNGIFSTVSKIRTLRHHLKLLLPLRGFRKCRWFVLQSFSHRRGRNAFVGLKRRRRRRRIINNPYFNRTKR